MTEMTSGGAKKFFFRVFYVLFSVHSVFIFCFFRLQLLFHFFYNFLEFRFIPNKIQVFVFLDM